MQPCRIRVDLYNITFGHVYQPVFISPRCHLSPPCCCCHCFLDPLLSGPLQQHAAPRHSPENSAASKANQAALQMVHPTHSILVTLHDTLHQPVLAVLTVTYLVKWIRSQPAHPRT